MKSTRIALLLLLFSAKTGLAQKCPGHFPARPGASWQVTNFNKKGILQSTIEARLISLKAVDSTGAEGVVEQVFSDKKGRETGTNTSRFRCANGSTFIDLLGAVPSQILGAYQNMELVSAGKQVEFPDSMGIGQELPDATIELQAKSGSSILTRLVFLLTKRTVAGREEVITTAGVFDCVKINYQLESRFGSLTTKRTCSVWLAKGAGMVKTEFFKKGKLEGGQQRTK